MDDSVRCLSSSSSPPPNPRSLHHEADENDQMLLKNQNPKGPPMKHFMAPTISAASKVAVLRKKILTERNESLDFSETHHQNTSNLVPKASPVHLHSSLDQAFSPKIASQKRISENLGLRINESEDNEHNSQFSDSSSKPYDPLTNYLSPRPKFLRYNPNRCREIFLRRESDIEKEIEGFDGQSSSVSPSLESSDEIGKVGIDIFHDHGLKADDEEIKDFENEGIDILHEDDDHGLKADDEEIEDFEKEGCLTLKGVFKFLLVSVVLLLLTWYISSMNSSESSPTIHLIRGLTAGYINGSNRAYDIAEVNSNWEDFIKRIDEKRKGINEFFNHMLDEVSGIESDSCDQSKGIEIPDSTEKPEPFQDDQIPITPDLMSNYVYTNGAYHELETELEGVDHKKGIENSEPEDKPESFEEYEMPPLSDLVDWYISKNEAKGKSFSLDRKLETEIEIEAIEGISVVGDGKVEENDIAEVNSNWEDFIKRIDEKQKGINEFFNHMLDEESGIESDSCDQSKGIEIPDSTEKPEPFQDDQIPITPDLMSNYVYINGAYHELETELEGVDHKEGIENSEPEDKSESFEEYEMPPLSDLVDRYVSKNEAKGKSVSLDRRLETENEIETIEGISVVGDGKVEENGRENVGSAEDESLIEFPSTKHSKYNQIYGAFIGIFLIIASSTLVLHLRCKRTPIVKSQPIGKSPCNPFSAENISSEDPLFPNMEEAHTAKVKSYPIPSAYFPTVEENTKDFPLTCAPTVELLGEFVVGEVQSSMKSCTKKTKAIEVKTKKMEFQAETKSIFVDKAVNRSAPLSTPELSAPTNMLSPSYGSSTTAKKKEDGSVKSTPVRRSSRIRNCAMSP